MKQKKNHMQAKKNTKTLTDEMLSECQINITMRIPSRQEFNSESGTKMTEN